MNLSIEVRRKESDTRQIGDGFINYANKHWPGIEQFESRFDILAYDYARNIGVYCEIAENVESGAITIIFDATDTPENCLIDRIEQISEKAVLS